MKSYPSVMTFYVSPRHVGKIHKGSVVGFIGRSHLLAPQPSGENALRKFHFVGAAMGDPRQVPWTGRGPRRWTAWVTVAWDAAHDCPAHLTPRQVAAYGAKYLASTPREDTGTGPSCVPGDGFGVHENLCRPRTESSVTITIVLPPSGNTDELLAAIGRAACSAAGRARGPVLGRRTR